MLSTLREWSSNQQAPRHVPAPVLPIKVKYMNEWHEAALTDVWEQEAGLVMNY